MVLKTCQLLLIFLKTALACNGDGAFCSLPFTKFTFPGSHNAGSFNLNIPEMITEDIDGIDVNSVLSCYYDTHHMNYLEQLNFGVRLFNPDLCTRVSGEPYTLYDCHSSTRTNEAGMGWGTIFNQSLDVMVDWLSVNPRELIVLIPGNVHTSFPFQAHWWQLLAEKFGECFTLTEETKLEELPNKTTASCVRISSWPSENVTMGELIKRDLRLVAFPNHDGWSTEMKAGVVDTYDGNINSGASADDLKKALANYADGMKPMPPNAKILYQLIGSASQPDFSGLDNCRPIDVFCRTMEARAALKKIDLSCVETMATRYNAALLQDDSQPHVYFSENDCPDAPCGCLGYQSPLEPIHQKLLDNGHHIFTIWTDYHEMGEGQSLPQVTRRMNLATLRRLQSQPEPIKTWWDCNWVAVLCVALPSLLASCCLIYLMLICCFPERYGVWIRKWWERRQDLMAQKRIAREEGREEARAYLREANGASPQSVGVTSVAPPAFENPQISYQYQYQVKETE